MHFPSSILAFLLIIMMENKKNRRETSKKPIQHIFSDFFFCSFPPAPARNFADLLVPCWPDARNLHAMCELSRELGAANA